MEPETTFPVENPEPVHVLAFVEFQVKVEDWPLIIEDGEAVRVAVGAFGGTMPDAETSTISATRRAFPPPLHVWVTVPLEAGIA